MTKNIVNALNVFLMTFFSIQSHAMHFLELSKYNSIGLYNAKQFVYSDLHHECIDCQVLPQAMWYFKNERILMAVNSEKMAGWDGKKIAMNDIAAAKNVDEDTSLPPLIWIGDFEQEFGKFSAKILGAINYTLINTTIMHVLPNRIEKIPLFLADKIPTNLSFWDKKTEAFFDNKTIIARGETTNRGFMARTVWPTDFKLNLHAKPMPLAYGETLRDLVTFENGGAKSAFESRKLWQRTVHDVPTSTVHPHADKPVMALILSGAQGDDDEAHGGHFAVATGRVGSDGGMNNWLVNNYYNLASNSEKGIIAAPTLLDNYFADVNSGQSYYRPSYMLVAVFNKDTVPARFQAATNRVYNHFYSGNLVYDHSSNNCAGISIDTLRELGWNVPIRGVEGKLKAIGAYFYVSANEKDLSKGRDIYDYLTTEKTRLFPAVTFDAMGENLLLGAKQWSRKLYYDHNPVTPFMRQIGDDIEAIYFVRIPQIPSSRAFGQAPVYSFDQFLQQAPKNRADWKTVPTTDNILPESLKNNLTINNEKPSLVPLPVAIVFGFTLMLFLFLIKKISGVFKHYKAKNY